MIRGCKTGHATDLSSLTTDQRLEVYRHELRLVRDRLDEVNRRWRDVMAVSFMVGVLVGLGLAAVGLMCLKVVG